MTTSVPLSTLFYENRGNISDKWEQYLAVYETELGAFRGRPISLLEVGIQNGGSMQVWAKYFDSSSTLVGFDIDERIGALSHAENVELCVVDATVADEVNVSLGERSFDVIIDDGSHHSADVLATFRLLFPRLNPGGRYFIEDLHCAYWAEFGGGLGRPESAVEFLKSLVDVLHSDHIHDVANLRVDVGDELLLSLRKGLAKVTFYDSLAVVERLPFEKVHPFRRVVAGDHGTLQDPMNLVTELDPSQLLFAEPLARRLESGLLRHARQFQKTSDQLQVANERVDQLRFEYESLVERFTLEQENSATIDLDRQRLATLALRGDSYRTLAMRSLSESLQVSARTRQANLEEAGRSQAEVAEIAGRLNEVQSRLDASLRQAAEFGEAVVSLRNEVDALNRSMTYRVMAPARFAARLARRPSTLLAERRSTGVVPDEGGGREAPPMLANLISDSDCQATNRNSDAQPAVYKAWREEFGGLSSADRAMIDRHIAAGSLPSVEVLLRLDNSDVSQIDRVLAALVGQRLKNWTASLVISSACQTESVLAAISRWVGSDARLTLLRPSLVDAAPIGPTVVVLTTSSSVLAEHALYLFADAANRGIRFAYGDGELVGTSAKALFPLFKPSFSPLHQQLHGYIGTTMLVDNRDGAFGNILGELMREEVNSGDLIFHVGQQLSATLVERIPFVITLESLDRTVDRLRETEESEISAVKVSIIIPTRDRLELLRDCIDSVLAETRYPRDLIQIIVVDNGSVRKETLSYLRSGERLGNISVLRDDGDFNFPRLNNRAAEVATGEVLILLNNDTTVLDPLWLARMVREAINPTVGVVGAKLLFGDYSVQHGGVVLGIQGVAAHVNHTLQNDDAAYHEIANLTHEVSAVTGACIAIRSDVYREIGGLDESLAVAFNDIDLCCASIELGYKNVYIGSALMFHHESKSRGYDLKPEQQAAFRAEAIRARSKHPHLYRDDPYYNPNLSLARPYDLAEPPRAVRPWVLERRRVEAARCILMLSSTHQIGHGVAVVIDIQARYLASLGHRVILGGPRSGNDFAYEGCERIELHNDIDAAKYAFECGADVVMMHTPPFFGTARWLGDEQMKVAYDYGEPPPDLFPDAIGRRSVLADKQFSMALADVRFGISEAVRDESTVPDMGVIPLGNAHLATWSEAHLADREATRLRHGWSGKLVVLNVCRFHRAERHYKGVDAYSALSEVMRQLAPEVAERVVFVLCGKADPSDVEEMEASGLVVRANVTDTELIELYAATDAYVNLSRWEGYNLGIGQALAMGLPVLASDIPAHRAFGILTTDDVAEQVGFIEQQVLVLSSSRPNDRHPRVWDWAAPLAQLARLVAAT